MLVPSVYLQKYPAVHKGSWDDIYYLQLAHLLQQFLLLLVVFIYSLY